MWGGWQDSIQQAEALEGRPLTVSEVSDSYVRRVLAFWVAEPVHALELQLWKLRLLLTDHELGNHQDERFFALHFGPVRRCTERMLKLAVQELGVEAARSELESIEQQLGPRPELAGMALRLNLR